MRSHVTDHQADQHINILMLTNRPEPNNLIKIGDVQIGNDRHKSILFKYICDDPLINLPCALVRKNVNTGNITNFDYHYWNLIKNKDNEILLVDFRHNSQGAIVTIKTKVARKYYRVEDVKN